MRRKAESCVRGDRQEKHWMKGKMRRVESHRRHRQGEKDWIGGEG